MTSRALLEIRKPPRCTSGTTLLPDAEDARAEVNVNTLVFVNHCAPESQQHVQQAARLRHLAAGVVSIASAVTVCRQYSITVSTANTKELIVVSTASVLSTARTVRQLHTANRMASAVSPS